MDRVVDFEQIVENQPFAVMRQAPTEDGWRMLYVSKSIERYGFTVDEFLQGDVSRADILHPDDRVLALKLAADYIKLRLEDFRLSYRILTRDGESIAITEYSHVNRSADGEIVCVDSVLLNTTMTQREEEQIRQAAFTDHLTGLPNRFRCDRDLGDAIANLAVSGGHAHALFIDLDDFKIVNDCYGHDYGDGVLISFAEYLRGFFRDGVYRFGGDEFVVIIPGMDDEAVRASLNALLERAKRPWASRGREFYCSLSMGVVRFAGAGDTPQSVIKKADIAMYQAKTSGKNNFAEYTEGLNSQQLKRAEMEAQLRAAMEDGCRGFVLHYQPYSDTKTGEVVGAAALLRMRGSGKTLLLPGQFLSLAEYLGLIVPLGEFVLAKAAEQCRVINSLRGYADFTVTINMSHRQLRQNDIVRRTKRILAATGVKLANIIISINETTALEETERMLRVAAELRRIGVRVALNDFGSGSSSFINMRALPVDMVKVSSKYLEDVEDEFTGAFIRLVTDLCHFSGKQICMNNVETRAQYDFCRKFGIDLVQGFLFHRPEDVNALLRRVSTRTTDVYYP